MNVNMDYYRIFYYVAKYGNFTKAARTLGNSQPNVTRAMNCLEQQLQCSLFIRTNRGVQLTSEGERLYVRVSAAMTQLFAAEEELGDSGGLSRGSISIGATETALNIFLLEKLKSFHMEYPGIRLKLYNHSTPQAVEAVKSGKIEFAVVTTPVEMKPPLKKIVSGNSGRGEDFYRLGQPGAFSGRGEELSHDLPWTGNDDLSVLQPVFSETLSGADTGYGGGDNRSDSASCEK